MKMGTDARVRKNTNSMLALNKLLTNVVADPEGYLCDEAIVAALATQSSLAKYESEKLGIVSSSINTLKRISESELEGGYAALDRLRVAALDRWKALQQNSLKRKTRLYEVQAELEQVKAQLKIAQQDNWTVSNAFRKSLRQAKYYATQAGDPRVLALCEREQKELWAMFSLRRKDQAGGSTS